MQRPAPRFVPAACSMCCGDVCVGWELNAWRSVCVQCGDERVAPFRLEPTPQLPAFSAGALDFTVNPPVFGRLQQT